jgi:hypothetical protein
MRVLTTVLMMVAATPLICGAQSEPMKLDQIVSKMEQARSAERDRNPGYTVTREYQLAPAGAPRPSSKVVAQVSFTPPSDKEYVIVKAEGTSRGAGIVRKVLDHEAAMAGHSKPYDVSPENYELGLVGRETIDGRDCYVLQLSPKREAVELVRGKAWVDARDFQIRRIDGETAKSPSFWIKRVRVTINYGQVNGIWLETSTQAVADVRLAGTHVLTSKELDVQAVSLRGRVSRPQTKRRSGNHVLADTAIWVAR